MINREKRGTEEDKDSMEVASGFRWGGQDSKQGRKDGFI